jgi:hypothetical protein
MQITSYYEDVSFRLEAINQIRKLRLFIVSNFFSRIKTKIMDKSYFDQRRFIF